jgi:hypothetical protein
VWKLAKPKVAKLCIAASNRNWQHIGRAGHDKIAGHELSGDHFVVAFEIAKTRKTNYFGRFLLH